MAKIILNDGTEEYVSAREARERVQAGEAKMAQVWPHYLTREMVAKPTKAKRKRRTKAEMEAAKVEETCDESDNEDT
jgi:hypothetical protein